MPVIAIVNRKGGSGKSTLAAHIAAWCARRGSSVMLGDVDRQQSARAWLRRRDPGLPLIAPWAVDQKSMLRVPPGVTHVVLDTPGGMQGFELARVVMFADAVIMPICNSMFDRESAAACHAELMTLPRVVSGRCRLVSVGMRIDGRTHAAQALGEWSENLRLPFLGALRETQLYVRSLECGMTIFDLPEQSVGVDLLQWKPILEWLGPLFYPLEAADDARRARAVAPQAEGVRSAPVSTPCASMPPAGSAYREEPSRLGSSLPNSLMPAQESMVHGARLSLHGPGRPGAMPVISHAKPVMTRNNHSAGGLQMPPSVKPAPHQP